MEEKENLLLNYVKSIYKYYIDDSDKYFQFKKDIDFNYNDFYEEHKEFIKGNIVDRKDNLVSVYNESNDIDFISLHSNGIVLDLENQKIISFPAPKSFSMKELGLKKGTLIPEIYTEIISGNTYNVFKNEDKIYYMHKGLFLDESSEDYAMLSKYLKDKTILKDITYEFTISDSNNSIYLTSLSLANSLSTVPYNVLEFYKNTYNFTIPLSSDKENDFKQYYTVVGFLVPKCKIMIKN